MFAAGVLFTGNVVRMAFYLVISLGAVAGLFILAGAHFLGAMQLMIYVGGTMVLLVFGVMLTAQSRFISLRTSAGEWVLAISVGGLLLFLLLYAALSVDDWTTPSVRRDQVQLADTADTSSIGLLLSGVPKTSSTMVPPACC